MLNTKKRFQNKGIKMSVLPCTVKDCESKFVVIFYTPNRYTYIWIYNNTITVKRFEEQNQSYFKLCNVMLEEGLLIKTETNV